MDDSLRSEIWDYLSTVTGPRSVDEIAERLQNDQPTIRAAVNHDWFNVAGDLISIAYVGKPKLPESYGGNR